MKYVKLDDVIVEIDRAEIDHYWDDKEFTAQYIIDSLSSIPYIEDIQPAMKAKWVEVDGHKHQCSHCYFTTNPWTASFYNYCPNCGASMR